MSIFILFNQLIIYLIFNGKMIFNKGQKIQETKYLHSIPNKKIERKASSHSTSQEKLQTW